MSAPGEAPEWQGVWVDLKARLLNTNEKAIQGMNNLYPSPYPGGFDDFMGADYPPLAPRVPPINTSQVGQSIFGTPPTQAEPVARKAPSPFTTLDYAGVDQSMATLPPAFPRG